MTEMQSDDVTSRQCELGKHRLYTHSLEEEGCAAAATADVIVSYIYFGVTQSFFRFLFPTSPFHFHFFVFIHISPEYKCSKFFVLTNMTNFLNIATEIKYDALLPNQTTPTGCLKTQIHTLALALAHTHTHTPAHSIISKFYIIC